jgi:hypothetical protein
VACDQHHHPDLFWALRGAGAGNFGVVTSFSFQPRPAPRMTNFHLTWSYVHAVAVVAAWQRWAPHGPDELAADLALTATGELAAEPTVEVSGAVLGSERDTAQLLQQLVTRANADPLSYACRQLSYRDTTRFQAERSGATTRPAPPRRRRPPVGPAASPSRSSSIGPCPARRSRRWSTAWPAGARLARTAVWSSRLGVGPIAGGRRRPPRLPIAGSCLCLST